MARPHSAYWIFAAAALVVLMSPSPAGIATGGPDRDPAARRAMQGLSQSLVPAPGKRAATLDRPGQALPTRIDESPEELKRLLEALESFAPGPRPEPADDYQSLLLPWREAPQTVSDPFALERRWTDTDAESPIAPRADEPAGALSPQRQRWAGPGRVFLQATGVAFLGALLLVPLGCSYAAGSVYGYARDGPWRR